MATATLPSPSRSTSTSRPSSSSSVTYTTNPAAHFPQELVAPRSHASSSRSSTEQAAQALGEDDEEPIEQIVYTSSAYTRDVPPQEIEQILTTSRRNNERDGITGLLLYRDGSFVQFLEGPQSRVRECYQRIATDPRHRGIVAIYRAIKTNTDDEEQEPSSASKPPTSASSGRLKGKAGKRDFKQWSMAYRPIGATPGIEQPNAIDTVDAVNAARALSAAHAASADKERAVAVAAAGAETKEEVKQAEDSFSELLLYSNRKVDLPADMSKRMRTLVTTFVKLLNRPL